MGWSWGTTIMGWYTAQNNDKVNRLVLYAPQWISTSPSLLLAGDKLGAYRTVTLEAAKARWFTGVPEDKKADLIPPGWFQAAMDAIFASDPTGSSRHRQCYMLYEYFAKLSNAPYKRYVQIGEGTHSVIMEKNRMQLFQAVQQFLDERLTPGQ